MCNDYRLLTDIATIADDFDELKIKIRFDEGVPNVEAREDIRITDIAPIVKAVEGEAGAGSLVNRRWSWPARNGKPVYNFRAEKRSFGANRCLVLADGFYEFTDPDDPKRKRLDKWLFTLAGHDWFCMAGIWRKHETLGEAFTLLTLDAGPDIAPYHHRQIIPLAREQWAAWLDPAIPADDVLRWLPEGSLQPVQIANAKAAEPDDEPPDAAQLTLL